MKQFKPSDLKQYMKVKYRNNGEQVIKEHHYNTIENYRGSYNRTLYHLSDGDYDIMEVYEPTLDGWKIIWKRDETKYMLVFPKEMYREGYSLIVSRDGTYQPYPINYVFGANTKRTFTQDEINAMPFNTDMFEKRDVE